MLEDCEYTCTCTPCPHGNQEQPVVDCQSRAGKLPLAASAYQRRANQILIKRRRRSGERFNLSPRLLHAARLIRGLLPPASRLHDDLDSLSRSAACSWQVSIASPHGDDFAAAAPRARCHRRLRPGHDQPCPPAAHRRARSRVSR